MERRFVICLFVQYLCLYNFQVYERLVKVGVTMSQKTTVRCVKKVGMGHDNKVIEWRDILAGFLDTNSEVNFYST